MFHSRRVLALACAAAICLPALLACASAAETAAQETPAWHWKNVPRVVIVGDVHGAYDELVGLLQATGIVDDSLDWSGGDAHLISLGDLLDRGSDSRAAMDLLIRLQEQAPSAGGRAHVVLGNHEQMNLIGDLRYVSAGEFAAFADDETPEMLDEALREFVAANPDLSAEERMGAFASRYPAGYFAHREAFRPDGRYGRWLLSLPTIIVVNGTAFVHGGLPQVTSGWTAEQLNNTFSQELKRYLETWRELVAQGALPDDEPGSGQQPIVTGEMIENPSTCIEDRAFACEKIEGNGELQALMEEFIRLSASPVNGYDAPFWYRGSVYCRDILERPVLDQYLQTLGAVRVVVGHTPTTDSRVRSIRDDKVIMADTGMFVDYYKGRPAALVMQDKELLVYYQGSPQQSAPLPGFGPVAYGLEESRLEEALTQGVIATVDKASAEAYWRITLDFEGEQIEARFFPGGRAGTANLELAAHALDRLLGTELIAATVARRVDDTEGALQIVYPGEISEQQRLEASLGFTGWCPMPDQLQLMYLFDLLTANAGRSVANVLYSNDDWTLRLTGHGLAFDRAGRLSPALPDDAITLAPGVAAALRRLDEGGLEAALGEYLDKRRIRALLSRRDAILQKFSD